MDEAGEGIRVSAALDRIEIVSEEPPVVGSYLQLRRMKLRNRYQDGTTSDPYPCDVMERPGTDAVAIVAYHQSADGQVEVLIREGIRPPIYLRKEKELPIPDAIVYRTVPELVAGGLEPDDRGFEGIQRRTALELMEEAGFDVDAEEVFLLGGGYFPSPGTYTEKVYLAAVAVDPARRKEATTDEPMEAGARLSFRPLDEAIAQCQQGLIPDPKAEMGLRRLAAHLGYIPELGIYIEDLPEDLRSQWRPLGLEARQ